MSKRTFSLLAIVLAAAATAAPTGAGGDNNQHVYLAEQKSGVQITVGDRPFGCYFFGDTKTTRPFFAHVHAPNGTQVTRNYPPAPGVDDTDHDTFHPGLWLAFGDLSGADFWRNKAVVKHVKFVQAPKGEDGKGTFTVLNHYLAGDKVLCAETSKVTLLVRPAGYLLLLDSIFKSDSDFYFGDQEEMGLGVRVATPLAVKNGGQITNSMGQKNEKQVWGKTADWCEYSGVLDGQRLGIVLMPHPDNFRKCWFHARDYGLLAANPFGQNAFTKGDKSKVMVKKGEEFRLRFGVLIYAAGKAKTPPVQALYQDYLKSAD